MKDRLTRAERSENMRRIRSSDTAPERAVAEALRSLRYKPETNVRSLPGTPDFVLRRKRIVIFVHGCFWHRHPGCPYATTPRTRKAFWNAKFAANVRRDRRVQRACRKLGWRVVVVWECRATSPLHINSALQKRCKRRNTSS